MLVCCDYRSPPRNKRAPGTMNFRKKKRKAGDAVKLDEICLFRFLSARFAFRHSQSLHNPFHPSPRHPLPIPLGPVFSQYLALVSLGSPFSSHRTTTFNRPLSFDPKIAHCPLTRFHILSVSNVFLFRFPVVSCDDVISTPHEQEH